MFMYFTQKFVNVAPVAPHHVQMFLDVVKPHRCLSGHISRVPPGPFLCVRPSGRRSCFWGMDVMSLGCATYGVYKCTKREREREYVMICVYISILYIYIYYTCIFHVLNV